MKKQLLRMTLVAVAMVFGASGVWADELTATLTHTASSSCAGDASAYTSTLDAEKEHVNNAAFSGAWQGAAYADFSFAISEGSSVTKATLTFHIFGESRRDRDCGIYYVNAGEQLDYEAIAAGNAKVNLPATQIGTVSFNRNGDNVEKTQDVTEAVKAIVAAGQSNIIFKWTGNPGGGDVAGKGLETAPVLVIETASAASQTKYTIKFVDEANNKIKDDVVYDGTIGQEAVIPAEDKANFYSEDGLKKYIFVSGETITLVADEASNVITLTFREAAIYNYTVNFVAGENVLGSKKGFAFEGDETTVSYPKYLANEGLLYTKDATNKEYNYKFTPEADGEVKALEYTAVEGVDNVVFLTEGEYVEDLTPCTTANTGVRSSNSASAYAAYDAKIAVLTPGTYKLHAIIYDASKTPDSHFIFKAGENQIADFNCTVINIQEFDSEEFTVNETCHLILAAVGSASIGLDALYITGDGDATAFENTYTLVGNCAAIFGTEWDVNNSANDMVKGENGIYTKTYKDVTLANDYVIEYKVVKNNSYDNGQWPYEGNQNYKVWEGDGVYNVTFTFDLANNAINCDMVKAGDVVDPNDYTSYIVNADLTGEGGFDATGTKGIDGSGIVKCANAAKFDFKQTITNLPAGQYKLTAKAAYRYGGDEQTEYNAIQEGTETKLAKLYATVGEKTVEALVQNRWDGASDTDYANGDGSVIVNEKYVPNSSNAVKAWFNAGKYVNEVVFNLVADGDVTIGIVKTADVSDYTVIGPWTLTRLGDAVVEPIVEDVYTVAGTEDLTGYFWDPSQNQMTLNAETGLYEWTAENVKVTTEIHPEFKIVKNGTEWYPENNWVITPWTFAVNGYSVHGREGIYDIYITFNPETKEITVEGYQTEKTIYTVVGAFKDSEGTETASIFGTMWDCENTSNDLELDFNGHQSLSRKADLEVGTILFKVVKEHSWAINYGKDGERDGANVEIPVEKAGSYTITFVFNPDFWGEGAHIGCSLEYHDPAVGISTVTTAAQKAEVYNMAGQRVMRSAEGRLQGKNAQKGLFIVNGKKVIR